MSEDNKYTEEYYDYTLDGKHNNSLAKRIAFTLLKDLKNRKGLSNEFDSID